MAPLPSISLYNIVSKWIISQKEDLELNIPEFDFLKFHPELEPEALKRIIDSLENDLVDTNKRFHELLRIHNPEIISREKELEGILHLYQEQFKALSILDSQMGFPNESGVSSYLPERIEEALKRLNLSISNLKNQRNKVSALQYMNILFGLRKGIIENIKIRNFLEAAKSLKDLISYLSKERIENHSLVAQNLKNWSNCTQTQLVGTVDQAFWDSIKLREVSSHSVLISIPNADTFKNQGLGSEDFNEYINKIISSQILLESSDVTIRTFESFIKNEILNPLFSGEFQLQLSINEKKEFLELTDYTNPKVKSHTEFCKNVLHSIVLLISFFSKKLSLKLFPEDFYPTHLAPKIRENLLVKAIPESRIGFESFSTIIEHIIKFENNLKVLGIIISKDSSLETFVGKAEELYLNHKRDNLLVLARAILLESNPGLLLIEQRELYWKDIGNSSKDETILRMSTQMKSLIDDIPLPILFPRCKAPDTIPRFISAIEAYLLEASTMEATSAKSFYLATRSIIDLYMALVPIRTSMFATNFRLQGAAIMHNECFYLAHELLTLGFRFRHLFANQDWIPCYLDFHTPLLDISHRCLAIPLANHQENALRQLQDLGEDGFRDLDQPLRTQAAESTIRSIIDLVDEISDAWRSLLPPRLFEAAIGGQILVVICKWFVDQILDLMDISEKESYILQSLAAMFSSKVEDLLPHTTAQAQVPAYAQLSHLSNSILAGSLADIRALHSSGVFCFAFTDKQIADLVLALFGASPARSSFINDLLHKKH